MKLNKSKNKGKVHPSPSSSSSTSSPTLSISSQNDPVSSLHTLLPTAILTLISILSLQDKEVLAYMITQYSSTSSSSSPHSKKSHYNNKVKTTHKIPTFDCGCFECYTSYWFRWDSSPHRELIHQAIEAFEEHLSSSELKQMKKNISSSSKGKRKEKGKKTEDKATRLSLSNVDSPAEVADELAEVKDSVLPENLEVGPPEKEESKVADVEEENGAHMQERKQQVQQQQPKGLARKVLPDVIGLFNSRLWNLWGPNV